MADDPILSPPLGALTPDELGVAPAPPAPVAPTPGLSVYQNPRQKLLMDALLGIATAFRAPGLLAGLNQGQQQLEQARLLHEQQAQQQFRQQQAEYDRKAQAIQADTERRRSLYGTNLPKLKAQVDKATSQDEYDAAIHAWAQGLQSQSLRVTPQRLMQDVGPFRGAAKVADEALDDYEKKPAIQQTFQQNPQLLWNATIQVGGRPMLYKDAWTLSGRPVDAQGQPVMTPTMGAAQQKSVLLDGKPAEVLFDPKSRKYYDASNTEITDAARRVRPMPPPSIQYPKPEKLIKVEHKDPTTGRAVIEWLPESEVRGKTFQKAPGETTASRLASAEAVNQTGNDIIEKLRDPAYAATLGPALGRASSLRDFIGNPPPEFSELAGAIESYSLANMGVHGMRSAQGAEKIKTLLDGHHTPDSLIAAIEGLNRFSSHFLENEGRPPTLPAVPKSNTAPSGPKIGERRVINGQLGEWDGKGWKAVR